MTEALTIRVFPDDPTSDVLRVRAKGGAPTLFIYDGKTYATDLFRLHDTLGFPLSASIDQCRKQGWIPCLQQFVCDAIKAGWPKERGERVVKEAQVDSQ